MKIQQSNIFEFIESNDKPLINNNLKLLSLFSGIGAFETALDRLNIKYELVSYCEIDKYASKSYSLIHNVSEDKNLWDITTVDTSKLPKDIDLVTYGFPCQDISLAGNQKGFEHNGERTRSGLFFEALRIIEDTKPKIAIAENVKNLTSKKFKNEFEIVLNSLEESGYNNYWQVLNAKDYGVPQNRERVFIISIRKDVDNGKFKFPEPFPLKLKLKDMLEVEVDEKYYLSNQAIVQKGLIQTLKTSGQDVGVVVAAAQRGRENGQKVEISNREYSNAITTVQKDALVAIEDTCNMKENNKEVTQMREKKTLFTETQVRMITPEGNVKRYIDSDVVDEFKEGQCADISFPNGYNKGPRVHSECPAINTTTTQSSFITKITQTPLRIRKLTPKECWRLMGFKDNDFEKVDGVLSNAQLYKLAGNSICVPVLEEIFKELFKGEN